LNAHPWSAARSTAAGGLRTHNAIAQDQSAFLMLASK